MKKNIQMLIGTNMTKLDFVKHWYLITEENYDELCNLLYKQKPTWALYPNTPIMPGQWQVKPGMILGNDINENPNQSDFWLDYDNIPNELKSKVTTKLSNGLESKLMKVE